MLFLLLCHISGVTDFHQFLIFNFSIFIFFLSIISFPSFNNYSKFGTKVMICCQGDRIKFKKIKESRNQKSSATKLPAQGF